MRTSSECMLIVTCSVAMLSREVVLIERKICKDCGGSGRFERREENPMKRRNDIVDLLGVWDDVKVWSRPIRCFVEVSLELGNF